MAVPRSGLIVEYTMDSINGSTLTDTSDAGGHNATIVGATVDVGIIGNCLHFPNANDGTSPGYYATMSSSFSTVGSYTISAWVKNTYWATNLAICCRNIDPHEGFFSNAGAAPKMRRNGTDYYATVANPITTNTWYHIAFRVNHSTNVLNFFINGAKLGDDVTQPNDGCVVDIVGAQRAVAGYYNHMKGCIDQLRMYNRALTEQEILDLYNEYVPPVDVTGKSICTATAASDPWTLYPKAIHTSTTVERPEIYVILGPGQEIIEPIGEGDLSLPACKITGYGKFDADLKQEEQKVSASGLGELVATGDLQDPGITVDGAGNFAAMVRLQQAALSGTGHHSTSGKFAAFGTPQSADGTGFTGVTGEADLVIKKQGLSAGGHNYYGDLSITLPRQRMNGQATAGNAGDATIEERESILAAFGFSDIEADVICCLEEQSARGAGMFPSRFNQVFLSH